MPVFQAFKHKKLFRREKYHPFQQIVQDWGIFLYVCLNEALYQNVIHMEDKRINPNKYGRDLGIEFYFYSGSCIATTRDFCLEHANKYFHYKEIMDWAIEDWEGKHLKTNEKTIFKYVGGYCKKGDKNETCKHVLMPASQFSVPKDVLKRNMDKGYFMPNAHAIKLLEL